MLSLSMKWENPAECEAVSKAWQPSTRSACETKAVMKQASKDLMADVGQDGRVMKTRLNGGVSSEAAGRVEVHSWNSLS